MEIQICQSCGIIIRGKSKFCTGCGTTISKFSPTTLPVIAHTSAPLAVAAEPDPLVLERAMNRVQYASALKTRADSPLARRQQAEAGGNGHNGGNGNGHGSVATAAPPQPASHPPENSQQPAAPAAQAASAQPASKLQNILGHAAAHSMPREAQQQPAAPAIPAAATPAAAQPQAPFPAAPAAAQPQAPLAATPAAATVQPSAAPPAATQPAPPQDEFSPSVFPATEGWPSAESDSDVSAKLRSFHDSDADFAPPAGSAPPPVTAAPNMVPNGMNAKAPAGTEFFGQNRGAGQSQPTTQAIGQAGAAMMAPPVAPVAVAPQAAAVAPPATPLAVAEPAAVSAPVAAPAPEPVAPPAPEPDPSAFDFFASSAPKPAAKPASKPAAAQEEEKPKRPQLVESSNDGAADIPAGMPDVVAKALRAATATNNNLQSVKKEEEDSEKDLFPDESLKRGKKKVVEDSASGSGSNDSDPGNSSESVRRFRRHVNNAENEESEKEEKEPFKLAGIAITQKKAITAAILGVVAIGIVVFVLNLLGSVWNAITSATSKPAAATAAAPTVAGVWRFGVMNNNHTVTRSEIQMYQTGTNVSGTGMEGPYRFAVGGTFQDSLLQLQKVYLGPDNQPIRGIKPVKMLGKVDWVNTEFGKNAMPAMHASGQWLMEKTQGVFTTRRTIVVHNTWEAALVQPGQAGVSGGPGVPSVAAPTNVGGAGNTQGGNWFLDNVIGIPKGQPGSASWATFFIRILGFLLLIGAGLVFASVRMFGPAGTLNISAKKQYIPSQFRAQHRKMLNEFSKPLTKGGLPLGTRADWNPLMWWSPRKLIVPPEVRNGNPHMLLIGAAAKGKSRLLAGMIASDIESKDRAVVVVDSDGGLVDLILHWVGAHPKGKEIAKRLVLIDPTHGEETLAYNPLEYPDDGDLQNAASAVVFGFKAIYTEPPGAQSQWNQQTADILRNSAILLMANGKTLIDLPTLLSENDFRDLLLEKVERLKNEKAEYAALVEAWSRYKRMARTDQWINWIEPILNRVNPMLGDPRIRPILTKTKGDLNLREIINEKKILLVKVPQGQLDQHANLLGSLLVTGVKQAALSLSLKSSSKRTPCALYLDEFDNFIDKETFDTITSETKKFGIGFVGASKTLQGLPEDYRNQLIINVGMLCAFALSKKDGDLLGPQMFRVDGRKIKNQTLQNIFNKVNTTPQFELITDEEKLNIDRVVGQEERTFFCYRVGTVAGVFHVRANDFNDIPEKEVNWTLIDQIHQHSLLK